MTIVFKVIQHVFSRTVSSTPATPIVQPSPPVDLSDVNDPGYQRASALCAAAESLHVLLTAGTDGHLDWNSIKSHQSGGWLDIKVRCDKIRKSLPVNNRYAGRATNTAIGLARRGKDVSRCPLQCHLLIAPLMCNIAAACSEAGLGRPAREPEHHRAAYQGRFSVARGRSLVRVRG